MTDFLTRLAERALGAGERVRPRLPPRFAPLPPLPPEREPGSLPVAAAEPPEEPRP